MRYLLHYHGHVHLHVASVGSSDIIPQVPSPSHRLRDDRDSAATMDRPLLGRRRLLQQV
jgi:hypothetical protein